MWNNKGSLVLILNDVRNLDPLDVRNSNTLLMKSTMSYLFLFHAHYLSKSIITC
jgi:hypothetical protein